MLAVIALSPQDYDAVLFDLDGVLTKTARVHAAAWKKLFDSFIERRATRTGKPFVPFVLSTDYPRYVDGKPRNDGVVDFLASRGIEIPLGASDDGPDVESVCGLGNLKEGYFLQHLKRFGVESYEESISLVRKLRTAEIRTAVVSASSNCTAVLKAAGIAQLFDVQVDGTDVSRLKLKGGALELSLTADNWSAGVTVRSAIDGRIVNAGAKLYRTFNNVHLEPLTGSVVGMDGVYLHMRTSQSHIHVAQVARTRLFIDGQPLDVPRRVIDEPGFIGQELDVEVKQGETLVLEKLASFYTSRDHAISECGLEAHKSITRAGTFNTVLANHLLAWKHLWHRFGVHILSADPGFKVNVLLLLRLNMFHLLQSVSPNSIDLDIGIPARGWTGEAYQGHIFWDELFIFPFFNYRMPEITRSLLLYRFRRLGEARAAAAAAGFRGAMFPWQSGSDGQEETQAFNLNPRSQHWVPDNSYLQRHVGSAVALNVWQYFQVTHDIEFLHTYGAEMILDIACFWSSIASFNDERKRYEIHGVMGPDEFHDGYQNSATPGLNNNAYTNIMAVWVLCRALEVLDLLSDVRRAELTARLGLSAEEIARWEEISRRMYVPFHDNWIISQFEGYEKLKELDWEEYRTRYGNIQRLDLILELENDSANRYKLSKQPDVLMLFYLFSAEEISKLFERMGYPFEYGTIPRNVAYYKSRSSHGSTLSRVVYAWVLARSDRPRAMDFFAEALQSDVGDVQHGSSAEGIHLGAMAGTVDQVQRVSTGIEVRGDVLRLNPELPQEMERLDMRIRYRGHSLDLRLTRDSLTVCGHDAAEPPFSMCVDGQACEFVSGTTRVFRLNN